MSTSNIQDGTCPDLGSVRTVFDGTPALLDRRFARRDPSGTHPATRSAARGGREGDQMADQSEDVDASAVREAPILVVVDDERARATAVREAQALRAVFDALAI